MATWKGKVKEGGTILFHDWNVHKEGFGAWKFWGELKTSGEYQCVEISNGYGLGIATKTKEIPTWHNELNIVLPLLKIKGEILANLQEERERVGDIEIKNKTLSKHANNLETIIEDMGNSFASKNEKPRKKLYRLVKRTMHGVKRLLNSSDTIRTN